MALNEIIQGSALERLKELESESVDCCITSPPYWALRNYKSEPQIWDSLDGCAHEWKEDTDFHFGTGDRKQTMRPNSRPSEIYATKVPSNFCSKCNAWKGSLGLEPTFNLYLKHLIQIFNEVKRVLKRTGSCWVNMGDTYNGAKIGNTNYTTSRPQWHDGVDHESKKQRVSTIPEKSLCLIPQRFQIQMVDQDWICRNTIIWYKPNCMPSSARDRFTVDFEYLFFFTKSQRYYFDTQYEPAIATGEYTTTFNPDKRKSDEYRGHLKNWSIPSTWPKIGGDKAPGYESRTYSGNQPEISPYGRIKRCVWKISTQPFSEAHFAVFPPELVETPIKACSKPNDLILDPFLGSGTVALVALQNARNFVGIELNPEYIKMAYARLDPLLKQQRITEFADA